MTKFITFLDQVIGWIAAAALGTCFALMTFSVFARYVSPTLQPQWVFEVCIFLLVWAILLGVARIEKRAGHIRVDFLLKAFSPKVKLFAEFIALLFAVAVAVFFIYSGKLVVEDAIRWDERTESSLRLPFWIFYASLAVSFSVHLLFILDRLRLLITKGESALSPPQH